MRFQKIFRFTLGSRILAIKVNAWNKELHTHYGITNQVPNSDMVIPFWDFKENTPLDQIINSLRRIQEDEYLGDIYIIQTYPLESYRALSFEPTTWPRYIKILSGTEHIDWSYVKHSVMRGRAVIRITNKVETINKLIQVLLTKNRPSILPSTDHMKFFHSLNIGFENDVLPDSFSLPRKVRVRLSKYESFR